MYKLLLVTDRENIRAFFGQMDWARAGFRAPYLASGALKKVVPDIRINPVIYQLTGSQCLSIGGLVRIDLHDCQNVTAVLYCSNLLDIHRGKQENGDRLWQKHYKKEH